MKTAVLTASAWLTLLGTIVLSQTVTFDYDRTACVLGVQEVYLDARHRAARRTEPCTYRSIGRCSVGGEGAHSVEPGDSPDVLVAYHISFDQNLRIDGFSSGWGPMGLGPDRFGSKRPESSRRCAGRGHHHARARRLVWRGLASGNVNPGDKPDQRDKKLAKATEKMFKNYPPRS